MNEEIQILEKRQYLIIDTSELNLVNFNELVGSDRKNNQETKTIIKWDSEANLSFTGNMTSIEGPYTNSEILNIVSGLDWQDSAACISFNV